MQHTSTFILNAVIMQYHSWKYNTYTLWNSCNWYFI